MDIRALHQAWATGQIDGAPLAPAEAAQRAAMPIEQFISQVAPNHPTIRAILEADMARSTGMPPVGNAQAMAQQFGGGGRPGPFTMPGAMMPPGGPMGGVRALMPPGMQQPPMAPAPMNPMMAPLPPRVMPPNPSRPGPF